MTTVSYPSFSRCLATTSWRSEGPTTRYVPFDEARRDVDVDDVEVIEEEVRERKDTGGEKEVTGVERKATRRRRVAQIGFSCLDVREV